MADEDKKTFRDKNLGGINTEEDLHAYLRGNSRSVWVALALIVLVLVVLLIWVDLASPLFLTSLLFGE